MFGPSPIDVDRRLIMPATVCGLDWVIVGGQTGPGAVAPEPAWVQSIIDQCREASVPVFLKDNLQWPERIREMPEV